MLPQDGTPVLASKAFFEKNSNSKVSIEGIETKRARSKNAPTVFPVLWALSNETLFAAALPGHWCCVSLRKKRKEEPTPHQRGSSTRKNKQAITSEEAYLPRVQSTPDYIGSQAFLGGG